MGERMPIDKISHTWKENNDEIPKLKSKDEESYFQAWDDLKRTVW